MPSTLVAIESAAQEPAIAVAKHPYDTELVLADPLAAPRQTDRQRNARPKPRTAKLVVVNIRRP